MKDVFNKHNIFLFLMLIESIFITWGLSGTDDFFFYFIILNSFLLYFVSSFFKSPPETFLERFLPITLATFIVVCIIQYFNYNVIVNTFEGYSNLEKVDYIKWLPTSVMAEFYKGNAIRSLLEIGATIAVAIACLKAFKYKWLLYYTLTFLGINMALMGIYAIIQAEINSPIIYNYFYTTAKFYGSFPLSNAASSFLTLATAINFALAIALLRKKRYMLFILSMCLAIICSVSSFYSGSEAGKIGPIVSWILFIALILKYTIEMYFSKKITYISIISLCVFLILTAFLYRQTIKEYAFTNNKEFAKKVEESITSRFAMYELSLRIISNNLIWGTGGNSCQYLLSQEMIKAQKTHNWRFPTTAHHAHSDILEFIMEFGIFGLMFIILCGLFWLGFFFHGNIPIESSILFLGITICFIHSCFDMHLHILSTMIVFSITVVASISIKRKRIR